MSKGKNVHPDHYKTGGSLRQGEDVVHHEEREKLGRDKARVETREPRRQVSSKTGKTSSAKKEQGTRGGFEPAPSARPVGGAFGKRGDRSSRRRAARESSATENREGEEGAEEAEDESENRRRSEEGTTEVEDETENRGGEAGTEEAEDREV